MNAQAPGWQWVQHGGGDGYPGSTSSNPGSDIVTASALDKDGNIIVGGYCSWQPVFDTISYPNVSGTTNWDFQTFFVAKYNSCGDVLWVNVAGGTGDDRALGLDVDESGNVYVFGTIAATGLSTAHIIAQNIDTVISNAIYSFIKFDKNGNLLYLKSYNPPVLNFWGVKAGMFKRLKSGNFVSMVQVNTTGGTANIDGFISPDNSNNLVFFDTLGNVIQGKVIDTLIHLNNAVYSMVLDGRDNIYMSYGNYNSTQVSLLGTVINPAPTFSFYVLKTNASLNLVDINTSGANNCGALAFLKSDGNYLYASDRNPLGASFDGDTANINLQYTIYKIDTNLNRIWTSKSDLQSIPPNWTYIKSVATDDYVYAAFQNRGTVTWDTVSVVTPANTAKIYLHKFSAADGKCLAAYPVSGVNSYKDAIVTLEADRQGNPYVIGNFTQSIGVPGDSVYSLGGANSPDYFILKWGLSCTDTVPTVVCNSSITRTNTDSLYSFNANATGTGVLSYQWSNNGTVFSTDASPAVVLDNAGSYTICVTVTDANNCVTTDCDSVTITAFTCSTTINAQNTDSSYSFITTNVGAGPFSYAWSNNGTAFSSSAMANLVLSTAGTYDICVTVTGSNNCQSNDCYSVTITAPPVCSTTVSYIQSDTTYNFTTTNTGTAPYTYEWTLNGQVWSSSAAPATALSSGTNNICVSVTDGLNCKSSDCETIVVSGISENVIELIELYPNPVQDQLYIGALSQTDSRAEIVLYDLSGRLVMSWQKQISAGKNLFVLDVSHLANGVYELQLKTRNEKWRGRIVKN